MMKLRGCGGPRKYRNHNLEPFALMAGLIAVTIRIRLFASVAVLTLPPLIAAHMAVTIGSSSGGRFGVNIVSGWPAAEYERMGPWPDRAHVARRYDYCGEYVQAMQEAWSTGRNIAALVLVVVIADEIDAAAIARWEQHKTGTDHQAFTWRRAQTSAEVKAQTDSTAERFLRPENQLLTHMPTLVGSYATIAGLLDTIGAMPGVCGGIQSFDGFERGVDRFGTRIQPCMQSRAGVVAGVS